MLASFKIVLGLVVVFGLGWGLAFGAGTTYGRLTAPAPTPGPGAGLAAGAGGAGTTTGGTGGFAGGQGRGAAGAEGTGAGGGQGRGAGGDGGANARAAATGTPGAGPVAGTGAGSGAGQGAGGFGQGAGGNRPAVIGRIEKVDGGSIVVRAQSGPITVKLTDSTALRKQADATMADLSEGISVSVTGAAGADGAVTANTIQILPTERAGGERAR
ncbi:MAG: hypothetical protein HY329_04835 [Chloroflexi bacterium]|nr:hypothetical protein [Chloroflexota bacterium]